MLLLQPFSLSLVWKCYSTNPRCSCFVLRLSLCPSVQTQMQSNELLREILGVSKWGGTGGEKAFYSKNSGVSKQQTTSRSRSRHSKQIAQDHILDETDDR